jgi:hypothetical protein
MGSTGAERLGADLMAVAVADVVHGLVTRRARRKLVQRGRSAAYRARDRTEVVGIALAFGLVTVAFVVAGRRERARRAAEDDADAAEAATRRQN